MEEDSLNVLHFAECRAEEIMTLMSEVSEKEPKSCLQRLPFHMRRRAASHNPKRVPRSVRARISNKPISKHKKKKKPHKNLLEEYNSRQKTDLWLPTHIWFAKRFHMKRMWGYQLPFQATGKRFRSSYRAILKNVLVQDLSYFCCIELSGEGEKILSKLSYVTDESLGMTFASESSIDGTREGHCFLYHPDTFPLQAIGPVSFLWKPCLDELFAENDTSTSLHRQLWIWCHPSITDEIVKILIEIFHLNENREKSSKEYKFASKVNYMKCKLHFQKEPVYSSDDITMRILKDTLVRHRVIGPNALSVITSILKPAELEDDSCPDKQLWNFLSDPQSAYYVPIKTVIGVLVEDPRLHVIPKRVHNFEKGAEENKFLSSSPSTSKLKSSSREFYEQVPSVEDLKLVMCNCRKLIKVQDLETHIQGSIHRDRLLNEPATAFSKLWDYEFRNEVTAAQVPEDALNKERGKYVIPNASDLRKHTINVPVILIQQPAINGYAPSWDLIAPQGWGMAFWIPFIYHGAQPAGLDDFCSTNFECGRPSFPHSFPDTTAGSVYEEKIREENLKKFYRYSRAKRPNFKILGVPSPFFMPWKLLVSEWKKEFLNKYGTTVDERITQNESDCFFVLRAKKDLIYLQKLCQKACNKEMEGNVTSLIQSTLTSETTLLKALVLVRVKCLSRGSPANCSGIYLPDESDLLNLKANAKDIGPVEVKHDIELSDVPVKKRRKILKEEAKLESKNLGRPEIKTVVSVSDRKLVGYISEGGYSRLGGQGYGIGHCTVAGYIVLLELCMKCQTNVIVLIREQHSFQYRPAIIEIISQMF